MPAVHPCPAKECDRCILIIQQAKILQTVAQKDDVKQAEYFLEQKLKVGELNCRRLALTCSVQRRKLVFKPLAQKSVATPKIQTFRF
jgi:hypothetical protein